MSDVYEQVVGRARAQLEILQEATDRLAAIRGRGCADGRVDAVVDATGALVGLTIVPSAIRLGAVGLGEAIAAACTEAAAQASALRQDAWADFTARFPDLMESNGTSGLPGASK